MERVYDYQAPARHNGDGQSTGQLFQKLISETQTMLGLEVELAKSEVTQTATRMGKDVTFLAAGGAVAYLGLLAIMLAVIIGLANFIPAWLSALIVGVVVALVGYAMIRKGMNDMKSRSIVPKQTIDTLQQDKQMVQEQLR